MLEQYKDHSSQMMAAHHSATCFLNSLFREWSKYELVESPYEIRARSIKCLKSFKIEISESETIFIPVKKISNVGRHQYAREFFLRTGRDFNSLSFLDMSRVLVDFLARDYRTNRDQIQNFKFRIENSLSNMAQSLKSRTHDLGKIYDLQLGFKETEQALLIGHSFHPTPKSREQFTDRDLEMYSPEFGGRFSLHWFMVRPEILIEKRSGKFQEVDWTQNLFDSEFRDKAKAKELQKEGYVPFPLHPWQHKKILQIPEVQSYLNEGQILDVGCSDHEWYPTSSLRSIYREKSQYMLKFSLSVRLTNSLRHLLPTEVMRGLQVHDVLSTKRGAEFLAEYPWFKVIFEPAFAALKDKDNKPISASIVVCRDNPFQSAEGIQRVLLATLAQENPLGGENLIQKLIRKCSEKDQLDLLSCSQRWFKKYLEKVVTPLIMAQAKYGILFGAHQQNLILEIQDGFPATTFFRDCQGTGYSQQGLNLFSKDVPLLSSSAGNILDEKNTNYLFSYYVVINSTFNVIGAITQDDWIQEDELLKILRSHLLELRSELAPDHDRSCLDYLIFSKEIMQKGNFVCCFKNINENTTENPVDIYNAFNNPIYSSTKIGGEEINV
jgi:N2-citryl-N6-acetyl-N6-hydroxylysine synthase